MAQWAKRLPCKPEHGCKRGTEACTPIPGALEAEAGAERSLGLEVSSSFRGHVLKNWVEKLLKKMLGSDFGFRMYTCRCTLHTAMIHKDRHTKGIEG